MFLPNVTWILALSLTLVQCKRNSPENKVGEPIIKQLHADVNEPEGFERACSYYFLLYS